MQTRLTHNDYFAASLYFAGSIFFALNTYTSFLKTQTFEQQANTYFLTSQNPHTTTLESEQFYACLTHQSKQAYEDRTNWQSLASMLLFIVGKRTLRNGRTRTTLTEE